MSLVLRFMNGMQQLHGNSSATRGHFPQSPGYCVSVSHPDNGSRAKWRYRGVNPASVLVEGRVLCEVVCRLCQGGADTDLPGVSNNFPRVGFADVIQTGDIDCALSYSSMC